jgi:hypothetical protein
VIGSDVVDDHALTVIADELAAYNDEKAVYRDYRPLAVLVSDPDTGEVDPTQYAERKTNLS